MLNSCSFMETQPRASSAFGPQKAPTRCHVNFQRNSIIPKAVLSFPNHSGAPSPPLVPKLHPRGKLIRKQETRPVQQPTQVTEEPIFLELSTADGVRLSLSASGAIALWERVETGGPDRLSATGNLHLPSACAGVMPVVEDLTHGGGRSVGAILRWGAAACPDAELHITALEDPSCGAASTSHPFAESLSRGFGLDFRVSARAEPSCAEVAIHLEPSGFWFGGGHFIRQLWPLNGAALEVGPWYAFDNGPNGVNTLLGPHWMTSKGLLVTVDPGTPFLHVGMNAPKAGKAAWTARKWGVGIQNATRELLPLTLGHGRVARAGSDGLLRVQARASYDDHKMQHPLRHWLAKRDNGEESEEERIAAEERAADGMLSVRLALCATSNAADALKMALRTHTPPRQLPSAEVFRAPIWTTWARYKTKVNQDKVLRFAREIADRGLPRSVMEIDDRWQVAYGDLSFDLKKFPNPKHMVDQLHELGFKVTVWVHPFVEENSVAYREGAAKGYFVGCNGPAQGGVGGAWAWLRGAATTPPIIPIAPGGSAPGFFAWWNTPPVAALDVTNPAAVEWFVGRLRALQTSTGVDGFKFDAGEPCFLPRNPLTHAPLPTPAEYTRLYVSRVAGQFAGGISEVRTGHLTQDVAVLCRMGDRFSTWDAANGLRSLIPTLLTSGLLGYPFCLPDMVGGNAYFGQSPDAELMVRWTQVSALMPSLQFSIPPWDLDLETEKLVASALDLRAKMEDLLLMLAEEAAHTLTPICRPLWMLAPHDEQTYQIHDQFALGEHVIVAPVVHRGAKRRDVYLTEGLWRNVQDPLKLVEGGRWLRGLDAPLHHLPVFVKDGAPGVYL